MRLEPANLFGMISGLSMILAACESTNSSDTNPAEQKEVSNEIFFSFVDEICLNSGVDFADAKEKISERNMEFDASDGKYTDQKYALSVRVFSQEEDVTDGPEIYKRAGDLVCATTAKGNVGSDVLYALETKAKNLGFDVYQTGIAVFPYFESRTFEVLSR